MSNERVLGPTELDAIVHEIYAVHLVILNLGILPEEIFVGVAEFGNVDPSGPYALVAVKRGEREFCMHVALVEGEQNADAFYAAWSLFSHALPARSPMERAAILRGSRVIREAFDIACALSRKGLLGSPVGWGNVVDSSWVGPS